MDKNEIIKSDRQKLMDLLYKLKKGELCIPNCYGCCGDNELSFAYCPDVVNNFEKELVNIGYYKVADDETMIKKSEHERFQRIENTLKHISTVSPTEAESENKALKETIAVVLAQKKNIWESYNKKCEELKQAKQETEETIREIIHYIDTEIRNYISDGDLDLFNEQGIKWLKNKFGIE